MKTPPLRLLRLTIALPVFLLTLLVALWLGIVQWVAQDRQLALDDNRSDSGNLVRALDEHVDSLTREVDQTVRFLKYRYEQAPQTVDIMQLLKDGVIINRYFTQLGILDEHGILIMTNKTPFKRVDLSDREHFRVHVDNPRQGLFISKPVLGRSSGKWSLQFTRRIDKADGTFGGVVVVSVDPFYFTDLYRDVDTGNAGSLMLVGSDGIVRASRNNDSVKLGEDLSGQSWFKQMSAARVLRTTISDVQGREVVVTARMLRNQPVAVVLQERLDDVLAEHYDRRDRLYEMGAMASLLLLLSGGFILRQAFRLQRSQQAAESANQMKSDFLAHMSHELRTPLNGILGAAELIAESDDVEEGKQLAALILQSGNGLRDQVDTILNLAKLEAGRMVLNSECTDLGRLLTEICDQHEAFARQKQLPILRSWDDTALGQAMVDAVRLRQVLGNLLHNAVKYTDRGEISVNAERDGDHLWVTISDTGIGIAPEDQMLVFDKFRQVERFTTRRHGGSGLGLALVRELVQLMRGRIDLQSVVGQGSHFTLSLPLRKGDAA